MVETDYYREQLQLRKAAQNNISICETGAALSNVLGLHILYKFMSPDVAGEVINDVLLRYFVDLILSIVSSNPYIHNLCEAANRDKE